MGNLKMIYQDNTLFITMSGVYTSRGINNLKKKMYDIVDRYGINEIVIDKKRIKHIDGSTFYDMLDEYDDKYGGNVIVEE